MAGKSKITRDHDTIRGWVEERGGKPACIKGTGSKNDEGVLRINFPDYQEQNLQNITWDEFFDKFDEKHLSFLYQDKTESGKTSRFSKLIDSNDEGKRPKRG